MGAYVKGEKVQAEKESVLELDIYLTSTVRFGIRLTKAALRAGR